jgi:biopolymer transport protein ExbD
VRNARTARRLVEAELDTLPFMGLFVVLIPLMLISAVFLQVSVIDLRFPGDDAPPAGDDLPLTLRIGRAAYVLDGRDGTRSVARGADDAQALAAALRDYGAQHPGPGSVVLVSSPDTRYEEIVAVMDVSRESGFPLISLAAADTEESR